MPDGTPGMEFAFGLVEFAYARGMTFKETEKWFFQLPILPGPGRNAATPMNEVAASVSTAP